MSEEREIDIYETPTFKKAYKRLTNTEKDLIDDEIDSIVADPEIGTQKKGDLSHLWVHKFTMNKQQVLLGYSWKETELELYLLNVGPHENFYKDAKRRRKADLKIVSSVSSLPRV